MPLSRLSPIALTLIGLLPFIAWSITMRVAPLQGAAFQIALIAGAAWAVFFTILAWVRLDEPAKEAHKFAWFWGSLAMAGLLLACMIPAVPALAHKQVEAIIASDPDTQWRPASLGFVFGVLATALVQIAGWAIVWSGWWLVRRR